jgi:GT2 family glycosyltransferase
MRSAVNVDSNLWLVIPSGARTQYLQNIFEKSGVPENQRVVVRTIPDDDIPNAINLHYNGEFNIHKWWNMGIDYARLNGARYVAVLNDDVELANNALQTIVTVMEQIKAPLGYPFPFIGWVCGYCWILDVHSSIKPDEEYKWWYGDRDLDLQARANGGVVHVPAMVRHLHGNELTRDNQELLELTKQDEQLFFKKWNLKSE